MTVYDITNTSEGEKPLLDAGFNCSAIQNTSGGMELTVYLLAGKALAGVLRPIVQYLLTLQLAIACPPGAFCIPGVRERWTAATFLLQRHTRFSVARQSQL